jgi:hypothetical protein
VKCWIVVLSALIGFASSAPIPPWLAPKIHLVKGFESDPAIVQFDLRAPLKIKSIGVDLRLRVEGFEQLTAFGKTLLEIRLIPQPGADVEFDTITITDTTGVKMQVKVGPNRVLYLKPGQDDSVKFEEVVMIQAVPNGLFAAMRVFNDNPSDLIVDRIIYAPSALSTNRVLLRDSYDTAWMGKLDAWSQRVADGGSAVTPPEGARFADATHLNVSVKPSRGFSFAVVAPSLKPGVLCPTGASNRVSAYLLPVVEYHIAGGPRQRFPIPTDVITDLCI